MKRAMAIFGLFSFMVLITIMAVASVGTTSASPLSDKSTGKGGATSTPTTTTYNGTDACTYAWRVVSSVNANTNNNNLEDIAANSATDIWSVGSYALNSDGKPLIEHWNGTNWSVVPAPTVGTGTSELRGVEAVSDDDAWAVGWYETETLSWHAMSLHWNGTSWSKVSVPGSDTRYNVLNDISAVNSNNVYAVGYKTNENDLDRVLIQHWDGTSWSEMSSPSAGADHTYLTDVTAISSNNVWAVGFSINTFNISRTFIVHWNGSAWSVVSSPNASDENNELESISAYSGSNIWAVGKYALGNNVKTLVLHWNGSAWIQIISPNNVSTINYLHSVSVGGANDVWAVGEYFSGPYYRTMIEHWDGSTWSIVSSPNLEDNGNHDNRLNSVVALSSGNIWTAGYYTNQAAYDRTLVERYSLACTTPTPSPTPTFCPLQFTDVDPNNTFYASIHCLSCAGIISGYDDGTFRPGNPVTRGQIAKIVSNAAGFSEAHNTQTFQDIPTNHTFYVFIERLASRDIIGGYACGGPGEPCGAGNKPYFRSNSNATRGQLSKIVCEAFDCNLFPLDQIFQDVPTNHTFFDATGALYTIGSISGYACGGPGEPCVAPGNLPYFRPGANVSRGQTAKIVSNTFFPACSMP